jgi:beta-glucanase (GH16 family)
MTIGRTLAAAALALTSACAGASLPANVGQPLATGAARAPDAPIFDDEFGGTSLDTRAWYACYPSAKPGAGCSNNPGLELEWYESQNVTVGGGYARLIARPTKAVPHYAYTSGMISTGGRPHSKATFSYLYGYAEARIQLPAGRGMWPAFWLIPANRTWPPEIDIMEWQGVTPKDDRCTIHWGTWRHPQQDGSAVRTGANLSAGFHTYAVDWQPGAVTWYFDGRAVKRYADRAHVPHVPMYVILNLAIGGWLRGQLHPLRSSFPATMKIDYVRIWKHKP